MLDHTKLAQALHVLSDSLFADVSREYSILQQVWKRIIHDETFKNQVKSVGYAPWPIPSWNEPLHQTYAVNPYKNSHYIVSVDGSQIYPDRHQSVGCYVINVGSVVIPYGVSDHVMLSSEPHVLQGRDSLFDDVASHDMVNAQRQAFELNNGYLVAVSIQEKAAVLQVPMLLLFDGSLIFWHLSSHEEKTRKHILATYFTSIMDLHEKRILSAWYISMPKSKELINLVRLSLCDFIPERKELYAYIDCFVDTSIMQFHLKMHERSIVFKNNAPVSAEYPAVIAPYFFYLHVGEEIGRVEIPAWIAQDRLLVDLVAQLILDQSIKGNGYPVALAEAHEQAVIKGPDRDLFYYLVETMGYKHNKKSVISKKSYKKQHISI